MRKFRTILVSIGIGFLLQTAEAKELTFSDAARVLLEGSEVWKLQERDLERSRLDQNVGLGLFYDPTLRFEFEDQYRGSYDNLRSDLSLVQRTPIWGTSLLAGYRKGSGDFPIYDSKYLTQNGGEFRLGLEVPILRGGFIDPNRSLIEKGNLINTNFEILQKANEVESVRQLGQRYWDWYVNEHRLKIALEMLEIAQVRERQLQKRAEHGDIAKIEVVEAERVTLQRRSGVDQARRLSVRSRLDLGWLLGIILDDGVTPPPEAVVLSDSLSNVSESSEVNLHPEVIKQVVQLEQAVIDRKVADNQFLPKLDLKLNWSKDVGAQAPKLDKIEAEVGLFLEWQIPSRANQARMSQARLMEERQALQVTLAERRIVNSMVDSKAFLETALSRVELTRAEVEVSKRLVDAELKRFWSGDSSLLMVNLREQNWLDSRQRQVEAISDSFRAKLEMDLARTRASQKASKL